jgi:hypothetical protein
MKKNHYDPSFHKDGLGKEIKVGDFVVYTDSWGGIEYNLLKVTGFTPKRVTCVAIGYDDKFFDDKASFQDRNKPYGYAAPLCPHNIVVYTTQQHLNEANGCTLEAKAAELRTSQWQRSHDIYTKRGVGWKPKNPSGMR